MRSEDAKRVSVVRTQKQLASSSGQTVRTPGDWEGKVLYTAFDPLTDQEPKDLVSNKLEQHAWLNRFARPFAAPHPSSLLITAISAPYIDHLDAFR